VSLKGRGFYLEECLPFAFQVVSIKLVAEEHLLNTKKRRSPPPPSWKGTMSFKMVAVFVFYFKKLF